MIIIFTGDGKGKTSAGLGVALRAAGHDMSTLVIQFMKKQGSSGEHGIPSSMSHFIEIHPFGGDFIYAGDDITGHIKMAEEAWAFMEKRLGEKNFHILILDELTVALRFGLLSLKKVLDFLKTKPERLNVIITGRDAQKELMDMAHIITEMKKIRHIYDDGLPPVKGIDF
ncbi:MAG TPA: cob(I)yrinic acid a,c-diamide adenosyltransferase [Syntrophorhabdaceae bacterium]|nr:cob(I)yrinic acid a,c-diamide adenosyltransferase [Syntrophorhabdaceae bacterium]